MKNFFIILIIKILSFGLKIIGKHGGNLPGKIAYDMNKEIFKYFKINCPVIAVVGTNGKTMAMPLSQLFEVLFDSSVVVKYPIF